MKRNDRWFLIGCCAVGLIIAIAYLCIPEAATVDVAPWHRSSEELPPDGEPVVAFYIWENEPSPLPVVPINGRYYAYNPGAPLVLIAEYPPSYWIGMPGGAE